jgi:hypothetical protein
MKKLSIFIILAITLVLQGCSKDKKATVSDEAVVENDITPSVTVALTATIVPTDAVAEPTVTEAPELVLPIADNTTGKFLIQTVSGSKDYPLNSYILSSSKGENVVIDPAVMPKKDMIDLHPAAITNTHTHADHIDPFFIRDYDCPRLSYVEGVIDTEDFHIYSILSSHYGDKIDAAEQNVIIVYEVDGIRIAQMADIGQTKLTDDQLTKLGDIDIAIMQFNNSWSDMSLENEKGFNLMNQLKPKIIITTNEGAEAVLFSTFEQPCNTRTRVRIVKIINFSIKIPPKKYLSE